MEEYAVPVPPLSIRRQRASLLIVPEDEIIHVADVAIHTQGLLDPVIEQAKVEVRPMLRQKVSDRHAFAMRRCVALNDPAENRQHLCILEPPGQQMTQRLVVNAVEVLSDVHLEIPRISAREESGTS